MYLEIITPEAILYSGNVTSISVPGVNGEFQMLDNHAPIISILNKGIIKIYGNITLNKSVADKFSTNKNNAAVLTINGGALEMKDNKVIVLVD